MTRPPRDLQKYEPAEVIANSLEDLAGHVRSKRGVLKYAITLSMWNPEWKTHPEKFDTIVFQITYTNKAAGPRE